MRSEQQAQTLPMRDLSDWQLDRVRDALRAYHSYGRDSDGAKFTWKDVREAITEYTGFEIGKNAKIGAERLRQFVFGVNDKENPASRTFPKPHPDNLQAIVAFVTHEELDLLRPEELEDYTPGPQALKRLHEYFYEGCDLKSSFPVHKCAGVFAATQKENDSCTIARLTLQDYGDDLLEVTETRELYDTEWRCRSRQWRWQEMCTQLPSYFFDAVSFLQPWTTSRRGIRSAPAELRIRADLGPECPQQLK